MSPILDSIGSVKAFGWGAFSLSSSYESIATVTVGSGGQSSVTFSSLPTDGTYKHYQIRMISRVATTDANKLFSVQLNGNAGANYVTHILATGGSSAYSTNYTDKTSAWIGQTTANTAYTNFYGTAIIDILDADNTNKYKTIRSLSGFDYNGETPGAGTLWFGSGLWLNTSAISSITVLTYDDSSFAQYSQFALYGIKGA